MIGLLPLVLVCRVPIYKLGLLVESDMCTEGTGEETDVSCTINQVIMARFILIPKFPLCTLLCLVHLTIHPSSASKYVKFVVSYDKIHSTMAV